MAIGTPATIIGVNDAVEQNTQIDWSAREGETYRFRFRGPAVKVYNKYTQLRGTLTTTPGGVAPKYDNIRFDSGRGIGELVAQRSSNFTDVNNSGVETPPDPVWELDAIEERVPLENHYYFSDLSPADIREVLSWVNDPTAGDPPRSSWGLQSKKDLYDLLLSGVTDYPDFMLVAKKTQVTTRRAVVTASFAHVGKAGWTSADIGIDNALFDNFAFLGNGTYQATNIDWLGRPPSVREVQRRVWEISVEYWGIPLRDGASTSGRRGSGWLNILHPGGKAVLMVP